MFGYWGDSIHPPVGKTLDNAFFNMYCHQLPTETSQWGQGDDMANGICSKVFDFFFIHFFQTDDIN